MYTLLHRCSEKALIEYHQYDLYIERTVNFLKTGAYRCQISVIPEGGWLISSAYSQQALCLKQTKPTA